MRLSTTLMLALRLLRRDWRCGELSILVAALVIAVTGTTAVSLLGHRLTRTMTGQAAEFLAADLVVSGHEPAPQEWGDQALALNLKTTRLVEFPTVLVEGDDILLTGVKAAGTDYPLRGNLRVQGSDGEMVMTHGPPPGEVWVEQRVLSTLNRKLGDTLTVGEKSLTVTGVLTHEPDRRGDLYSLSPRVLIHLADLDATGVIQPGSHAHYYALFGGGETTEGVPTVLVTPSFLASGPSVVDLLVLTGIMPSKGEVKRLIQGGGLYINEVRVDSPEQNVDLYSAREGVIVVRRGKKQFTHIRVHE